MSVIDSNSVVSSLIEDNGADSTIIKSIFEYMRYYGIDLSNNHVIDLFSIFKLTPNSMTFDKLIQNMGNHLKKVNTKLTVFKTDNVAAMDYIKSVTDSSQIKIAKELNKLDTDPLSIYIIITIITILGNKSIMHTFVGSLFSMDVDDNTYLFMKNMNCSNLIKIILSVSKLYEYRDTLEEGKTLQDNNVADNIINFMDTLGLIEDKTIYGKKLKDILKEMLNDPNNWKTTLREGDAGEGRGLEGGSIKRKRRNQRKKTKKKLKSKKQQVGGFEENDVFNYCFNLFLNRLTDCNTREL